MARRALPKIDPAVDVATHLKKFEELSPWDPTAWFGRQGPLEVEVGSGKGLFLERFGMRRPEMDFLGIEISHKYARFAAFRSARRGLPNVRVADADGLRVFRELIPSDSLAAVHVYFPDPWWKSRHHKRRVLNEAFVKDIERTLSPGGSLHFWTDVEEYYTSTLEILAANSKLQGPLEVPELSPEDELDYRTHRERRVRLDGDRVFRSEFKKAREAVQA